MRKGWILSALLISILALLVVGCGQTEEVAEDPFAEDWSWLQDAKQTLSEKRQELADATHQLANPVDPEAEAAVDETPAEGAAEGEAAAEGETVEPAVPLTPEELEAKIASLGTEIETTAEEFGRRLVEYINNQGASAESAAEGKLKEALGFKIEEDILIAKEHIVVGGDYQRALDIYGQLKQLDPENAALAAAVEEAETNRYVNEERFTQVKKKMSQDEVREILGQVYFRNIKEYEDRGVTAWFYNKNDGGAAGVFFKEKKKDDGIWTVYELDYDAVKPKVIEAGEADAEGGEEAASE